jgi:hypothetical protein
MNYCQLQHNLKIRKHQDQTKLILNYWKKPPHTINKINLFNRYVFENRTCTWRMAQLWLSQYTSDEVEMIVVITEV